MWTPGCHACGEFHVAARPCCAANAQGQSKASVVQVLCGGIYMLCSADLQRGHRGFHGQGLLKETSHDTRPYVNIVPQVAEALGLHKAPGEASDSSATPFSAAGMVICLPQPPEVYLEPVPQE